PRTSYRRLADYEAEMRALAERYPGHVRLLAGAHKTLEGRTVLGLEIAADVHRRDGRPTSYFDGLHHAREWPAAESVMNFAIELAEGYGDRARVTKLLETTRVILIPVVNVDGFHHSREAVVDMWATGFVGAQAYWRKNRRGIAHVPEQNLSIGSYGVDPNRNYGFLWGYGGIIPLSSTSSVPASQTYQGETPFSEAEARNVRDVFLRRNVVTMLTTHTVAGLVLWPWGHTYEPTPDDTLFQALGKNLAVVSGYRGQPGIALYPTTGTTDDWAYALAGTIGFTLEIGGNDFHPPYRSMIAQYRTDREIYYRLAEAARVEAYHSVVSGVVTDATGAPVQASVSLRKVVDLPLSRRTEDGVPRSNGPTLRHEIELEIDGDPDGRFEWHVNPSAGPLERGIGSYELVVSAPGYQALTRSVSMARGETLDLGRMILFPS
ncbi:MAG TPA: M14 family zinc carboxypeptidase, partial [Actinomycetota bacterium]|nr:M14 family zinc carboxypeptidase [Actinomycetota bacterium]